MQWLLCVVSLIGFVRAQDAPQSVCGLPPNPRFQSRESNVPFCVVLTGDVSTANGTLTPNVTQYTWFYPTVEEFTLFEIDLSSLIYRNISYLHIEVGNTSAGQAGNFVSERVQYSTNDRLVPSFHGYFNVVKGIATGWVWDPDARELCTEDTPVLDRFCSETRSNCYFEDQFDCDVQIYVGWSGTDVNDVFLQSRESLLSNYRLFSTAELYKEASASAREQINGISIPPISDLTNLLPGIPGFPQP